MKYLQARFKGPVQLGPGHQVNSVRFSDLDTSLEPHDLGVLVKYRGRLILVPWSNVADVHFEQQEARPSPRRGDEGPSEATGPSQDGKAEGGEEQAPRRRRRVVRPAE